MILKLWSVLIFIPSIGLISIGKDGAVLKSSMPIKFSSTINASGLPIAADWLAEKAEGLALVDENTLALSNDDDFGLKTLVLNAAGAALEGADSERPNRLWLIKFSKKLADFSVPVQ